jgi:hypothetical protein
MAAAHFADARKLPRRTNLSARHGPSRSRQPRCRAGDGDHRRAHRRRSAWPRPAHRQRPRSPPASRPGSSAAAPSGSRARSASKVAVSIAPTPEVSHRSSQASSPRRRAANGQQTSEKRPTEPCGVATHGGRTPQEWSDCAGHRRQSSRSSKWPVTPEVAGSSPVAPVKSLQISLFCRYSGQERAPASRHPALIPLRT